MPLRRFPPPWKAEEHDTCFIVKDHTGLNLAYVYFQNDPGCRSAAKLLSRAEPDRNQNREPAAIHLVKD